MTFKERKSRGKGGGSGSGGSDGSGEGPGGYKPGQNYACRVIERTPGGYYVILTFDSLPGFFCTDRPYHPGQNIVAKFVKVENNRMFMEEVEEDLEPADHSLLEVDFAGQFNGPYLMEVDIDRKNSDPIVVDFGSHDGDGVDDTTGNADSSELEAESNKDDGKEDDDKDSNVINLFGDK